MPSHSTDYSLTILSKTAPISARAVFPSEFLGFQGHFPTGPILPGFFHIQFALDVLKALDLPATLEEIPTAKFTRPILPNTPVTLTLTPNAENTYDAIISEADDTCSSFSLRCSVHKS